MPRIPASEYAALMEQARACVERLCSEHGVPVPPLAVQRALGWGRGTTHDRLMGAAERGLLRYHEEIGAYSPAVDAGGRPLRLVLVAVEEKDK
jgi:hypothetical protein